jgi:hypothetical protein
MELNEACRRLRSEGGVLSFAPALISVGDDLSQSRRKREAKIHSPC